MAKTGDGRLRSRYKIIRAIFAADDPIGFMEWRLLCEPRRLYVSEYKNQGV